MPTLTVQTTCSPDDLHYIFVCDSMIYTQLKKPQQDAYLQANTSQSICTFACHIRPCTLNKKITTVIIAIKSGMDIMS
jgi:hypothetical protein